MAEQLSAAGLAKRFGKSRAAVSQWVSSGKLAGCYTGEGRQRRFDLAKCAAALNERMDVGQALGNGAGTDAVARDVLPPAGAQVLAADDIHRLKMAKVQVAEADARQKRRRNAEEEGAFVLARTVQRETARLIGGEIAAFEAMLAGAARTVADETETDFKVVRKILLDRFRAHRAERSKSLAESAAQHSLSDEEADADI